MENINTILDQFGLTLVDDEFIEAVEAYHAAISKELD